jgi:hypothetical protein
MTHKYIDYYIDFFIQKQFYEYINQKFTDDETVYSKYASYISMFSVHFRKRIDSRIFGLKKIFDSVPEYDSHVFWYHQDTIDRSIEHLRSFIAEIFDKMVQKDKFHITPYLIDYLQ